MAYPKLEYKYLYRTNQLESIRARVKEMCGLDPFSQRSERGEYTVRSVYYDTRFLHAYNDKIEGVKFRRKYRVRVYGEHVEDSLAFLEIKQKRGVLLTKFRTPVLYADLDSFFNSRNSERYVQHCSGDGVSRDNAKRFLYHYYRASLRPVVLVTYDREAFVGIHNSDLRLTLDKNIRSLGQPTLQDIYQENVLLQSMPGHGIFEVKFTQGVPRWLRMLVQDLSLKRMALSKYTICLDALKRGFCSHSPSVRSLLSMDAITRPRTLSGRIH